MFPLYSGEKDRLLTLPTWWCWMLQLAGTLQHLQIAWSYYFIWLFLESQVMSNTVSVKCPLRTVGDQTCPPILPWVTDFSSEIDLNSDLSGFRRQEKSPWRDLSKVGFKNAFHVSIFSCWRSFPGFSANSLSAHIILCSLSFDWRKAMNNLTKHFYMRHLNITYLKVFLI